MPRLSVKQVVAKSKRAFRDLMEWQPILNACYSAAMPLRNPYGSTGDGSPKGARPTQNRNVLYDSTLAYNAQRLANHIKSELMPSEQEWVDILPGAMVPDGQKSQAKRDLQVIRKQAFAALQMSNFDSEVAIWILEMIVSGTGCMMKLDGPNEVVHWSTVTQAHVGLLENPLGMIDFVSRKYHMNVDDIRKTWRDAKMTDDLKQKIAETQDKGTEDKVYLCDACYWDMDDDLWYYSVVLMDTDGGEPVEIVKRQYVTMQWVVGRWTKLAHSARGRGPVELALPDHLTLNRVKELLLKNASLAVAGVWISRDAKYFNTNSAKIRPGAILPVRATGGPSGASISRLDVGGDLQLAQIVINDLVASIQKIMLNMGLPDEAGPVRSATEIMARLRQLQQDIGTPFTRILYEGVAQILQIVIMDLAKKGVIQIPNVKALKFNNGMVRLHFTSPLAQSQRMRDVENLIQAMQLTASAAPEMAQQTVPLSYKIEDIGYWIGDKLGVDATLLRDETDRGQIQGMAGQLIGNQVAMGQGSVGGVPTPGSGGGAPAPQAIAA